MIPFSVEWQDLASANKAIEAIERWIFLEREYQRSLWGPPLGVPDDSKGSRPVKKRAAKGGRLTKPHTRKAPTKRSRRSKPNQ
jgi:hypothetical protein